LPDRLLARVRPQLKRSWHDGDAGVHSAARWLAAKWQIDVASLSQGRNPPRHEGWYADREGHELAVVRGYLDYDFALSTTEVTVDQYRRFDPNYDAQFGADLRQFLDPSQLGDCPAIYVNLYDAMRYCNWLSLREGIEADQHCYEESTEGSFRPKADYQRLAGFRLPLASEWKYACLGRSTTTLSFGDRLQLLPSYAWYFSNSRSEGQHRARPIAGLKPNALGLFDMYGNVWEWASDADRPAEAVLIGGSCDNDPVDLINMDRHRNFNPEQRQIRIGFRVAQTVFSHRPPANRAAP
jgi:formylglycine-generating enzyme required for sulfatase activity